MQLVECPGYKQTRRWREGLGERQQQASKVSRDSKGILLMKVIAVNDLIKYMVIIFLRDSRIAPQHPKKAMTNTNAPRAMIAAGKNPG